MASVLILPPPSAYSTLALLSEAEVAPFTYHVAAELGRIDPHGVVGWIAGIDMSLGARLDVRPDPSVPEELDGGLENAPDERFTVQSTSLVVRQPERTLGLWRE